jgi:hypothetical protein
MGGKNSETCGRCAMSSVTGTLEEAEDPYGEEHIEVDDHEARLVSPAAWFGGVKRRLDDLATRLTYGR